MAYKIKSKKKGMKSSYAIKKTSPEKFREIADEYAMTSDTKEDYVKFMRLRFPYERSESYMGEWAERFIYGRDWGVADGKSRKILIKIGRRTKTGKLIERDY